MTWMGRKIKGHLSSPAPSDSSQRKEFVCTVDCKAERTEVEPVAKTDSLAQLRQQQLKAMNFGSQGGTEF